VQLQAFAAKKIETRTFSSWPTSGLLCLISPDGHRYRLHLNCAGCEMEIVYERRAAPHPAQERSSLI
jgi:hypothetical protein